MEQMSQQLSQTHQQKTIREANEQSYNSLSDIFGENMALEVENSLSDEGISNTLKELLINFINDEYDNKSYVVDGVCLREKILNCAVHMKHDIEMVGFISKLIDNNSRFVMVDFGDKEGAVNITKYVIYTIHNNPSKFIDVYN